MKKTVLILFTGLFSLITYGQDITGQWNGILKVQAIQLRIIFNIVKTDNGYSSTMDSPDQGVKGIPVTSVVFDNSVLKLEIATAKIEYIGTLDKEYNISGNFNQGGQSIPLNLSREKIEKEVLKRPQEPLKPYPYYTENVIFENKKDNITLSGTLSLPTKEGNYPAVILITGSGPQNRDEELFGHKPFLVLADELTKNGIAVLRFDDRGIGESKGNYNTSTTLDFASDVESAVNYLQTRKEINRKKIGLIGHSEGGLIAPMVAGRSKEIRFIVLLAGPGIPGGELMLLQKELLERNAGANEADIQKGQTINKGAFDIIIKSQGTEQLKEELSSYFKKILKDSPESKPSGMTEEIFVNSQVNQLSNPWMQYFIRYNPAIILKDVKCPVLALNGEKDLQVPPKINLEAIKKGLVKGGNKNVTTIELAGLNHLFQECKTCLPDEYGKIEQTFSPVALQEIKKWISEKTK
jgi:pimeloyl-ACP methyl ester carboxylesterase